MKKLLIAGSRTAEPSDADITTAAVLLSYYLDDGPIVVVHGNAKGADQAGDRWAKNSGRAVEVFLPDWKQFGKQAGFVRNAQMVNAGVDAAIVFWDGSSNGTKNTLSLLEREGVPRVVVVR